MPGITPEQLVRLDKLAQTVVFTSQGIPFIYAGEEVMRDKKGVDNSYKSPDAVNAIDWRRKTTNEDVFTYYKRLIDLRKSHPPSVWETRKWFGDIWNSCLSRGTI